MALIFPSIKTLRELGILVGRASGFNTDQIIQTSVLGNIGLFPPEVLKNIQYTGNLYNNNSIVTTAQEELNSLINYFNSQPSYKQLTNDLFFENYTLTPGFYKIPNLSMSSFTELYFDAQDNPNAIFVIISDNMLIKQKFNLLRGAQASNIYWISPIVNIRLTFVFYGIVISSRVTISNYDIFNTYCEGNIWLNGGGELSMTNTVVDPPKISDDSGGDIEPFIPIIEINILRMVSVQDVLIVLGNNKCDKIYKLTYRTIKNTIKYVYYVILLYQPQLDTENINYLIKNVTDKINNDILYFNVVGQPKYAQKLEKIKKKFIMKVSNLKNRDSNYVKNKIHKYYLKLKKYYIDLLNLLIECKIDKLSSEEYISSLNSSLDEFHFFYIRNQ